MKRTLVTSLILAAALAVAVPGVLTAQQSQKDKGMGPGMGMMSSTPCTQMMGKGMMSGQGMRGMGHGMGHGMGFWSQKLSDKDRGDLLVLKGQLLRKKAELLKKDAEEMIAEGKRLQKGGK